MLLAHFIALGAYPVAAAIAPPSTPPILELRRDPALTEDISDPPSAQTINDIERLSLAEPWSYEPSGAMKTPTVEIANISCRKSAFRHFACQYDIRVREYGRTEFGQWYSRKKVFGKLGSDWLMLNAEARCSTIDAAHLPDYCFPRE